jgi:O-antigen/teichoic acid export membrane protein
MLALGIIAFGGKLLNWMGNGQIATPYTVILLVAAWLALGIIDAVLAHAVLASLGMVNSAVRATYISSAVGLQLVVLGARHFGAEGALGGVIVGFLVRIVIELIDLRGSVRPGRQG